MYEVQLVGESRPVRVDADQLYIHADPGVTAPHIVLTKDKETVFFAPFDSIISVQKYTQTGCQSGYIKE
jgi:hypothetical protein